MSLFFIYIYFICFVFYCLFFFFFFQAEDGIRDYKVTGVQTCALPISLSPAKVSAGGPVLTFAGDSDAHIVRGLIAILFAIYSGKSAREILNTDAVKLRSEERRVGKECRLWWGGEWYREKE